MRDHRNRDHKRPPRLEAGLDRSIDLGDLFAPKPTATLIELFPKEKYPLDRKLFPQEYENRKPVSQKPSRAADADNEPALLLVRAERWRPKEPPEPSADIVFDDEPETAVVEEEPMHVVQKILGERVAKAGTLARKNSLFALPIESYCYRAEYGAFHEGPHTGTVLQDLGRYAHATLLPASVPSIAPQSTGSVVDGLVLSKPAASLDEMFEQLQRHVPNKPTKHWPIGKTIVGVSLLVGIFFWNKYREPEVDLQISAEWIATTVDQLLGNQP